MTVAAERAPSVPAQKILLHAFPNFGIGGVPLRMCRIINHLGNRFHHAILALDGNFAAEEHLAPGINRRLLPQPQKRGTIRSAIDSFRVLRRIKPDLLITYNWGSIEWAMVNRLASIAPHIHIEAGFGREEADTQLRRRVLFRRHALARCMKVLVPSHKLEALALTVWKLPSHLVEYVPNGVDVPRFSVPRTGPVAGFSRQPGELIIGTVAPLRPEKNLGRLLRTFAVLTNSSPVRLVIAGEGGERPWLESLSRELGICERVIFTGQVLPESILHSFDVFALSSDTEQMPNSLLEAMASGRPVVAVDVGDVRSIVSPENRPFVVPRDNLGGFVGAMRHLLCNPELRERLGESNRARALEEYSQERMFEAYDRVLSSSLGD